MSADAPSKPVASSGSFLLCCIGPRKPRPATPQPVNTSTPKLDATDSESDPQRTKPALSTSTPISTPTITATTTANQNASSSAQTSSTQSTPITNHPQPKRLPPPRIDVPPIDDGNLVSPFDESSLDTERLLSGNVPQTRSGKLPPISSVGVSNPVSANASNPSNTTTVFSASNSALTVPKTHPPGALRSQKSDTSVLAVQGSDESLKFDASMANIEVVPSSPPAQTPPSKLSKEETAKSKINDAIQSMSDVEVSLLTDVLGDSAITILESDSWEKKRHLVNQAERLLFETKKIQDPESIYMSICILLRIVLQDKVHPLLIAAFGLLQNMIDALCEKIEDNKARFHLSPLLPMVISKGMSSNSRLKDLSHDFITSLSRKQTFGPTFVSPFVSEPIKAKLTLHSIQGRANLLLSLINDFGLKMGPFEPIVDMSRRFLEQNDTRCRQYGVDIISKIRTLVDAEEYKRLESRLSDTAFKRLHLSNGGDASALHPEDVEIDYSFQKKPQVKVVEDSAHYRSNKNSISWAIGDSQSFAIQEKSDVLHQKPHRPHLSQKSKKHNHYKERALVTPTPPSRTHSAASNYSGPSNLTREEEELMQDIMDGS